MPIIPGIIQEKRGELPYFPSSGQMLKFHYLKMLQTLRKFLIEKVQKR